MNVFVSITTCGIEVKTIKYIYFLIQILTGLPIVKITFQFENWNSLFKEL